MRHPAPELTVYEPDDWLRGAGTDAAATARLIVYAAEDMEAAPEIRVFRAGENEPHSIGRGTTRLDAGQTVVFTWDLSHLQPGDYELACQAAPVFEKTTPRLAFSRKPVWFETFKIVDGVDLKLFVFQPQDHKPADKRPVVVFFHGGGYRAGTPSQFKNQCRYLASRGIVGITVLNDESPDVRGAAMFAIRQLATKVSDEQAKTAAAILIDLMENDLRVGHNDIHNTLVRVASIVRLSNRPPNGPFGDDLQAARQNCAEAWRQWWGIPGETPAGS